MPFYGNDEMNMVGHKAVNLWSYFVFLAQGFQAIHAEVSKLRQNERIQTLSAANRDMTGTPLTGVKCMFKPYFFHQQVTGDFRMSGVEPPTTVPSFQES